MRILTVVGNRPQFVKAAPLSVALGAAGIDEIVLHTGQHWDPELSAIFFSELGLAEPHYRLDLHTADVETMRPAIEQVVRAETPNWVLVYGDTASTAAGAQAAVAAGIPLAHVEAGLRSGDLSMPEERYRLAVDAAAALLFCPDDRSAQTLRSEGVGGEIAVVGDVMADASMRFAPLAREHYSGDRTPGSYIVCTVHREANVTQPRLGRIVEGLARLEEPVVFPAHPRTRAALERERLALAPHVELTAPLGYLPFTALASSARVV